LGDCIEGILKSFSWQSSLTEHLVPLQGNSDNFASLDPSLQERGIKGLTNGGKLDKVIWNEFFENWEQRAFESEKLRAQFERSSVEAINEVREEDLPREGKERERLVMQRV
jgi:putative restriction endonuclease